MFQCKICNFNTESKSGLAQHIIRGHKKKYLDYLIEYNLIVIPLCFCGLPVKFSKHSRNKTPIKFIKTCGNKKCTSHVQREHRLLMMKLYPEKSPWRLKNMSYPEKVFKEALEKNGYDKRYLIVRERPVFPYFIDFAFENEKIAIEIDGSQHLLPERQKKDKLKDEVLNKHGWRVIRFPAKNIIGNMEISLQELNKFLLSDIKNEKVGIIEYKQIKEKTRTWNEYIQEVKNNNFENIHKTRIDLINKSKIDFSRRGWVMKIAKEIDAPHAVIKKFMKKWMPDFYEKNCIKTLTEDRKKGVDKQNIERNNNKNAKLARIQNRKNIILNSNIQFGIRGWLVQISKLLKIGKMSTIRWIKKYMPELYIKHNINGN